MGRELSVRSTPEPMAPPPRAWGIWIPDEIRDALPGALAFLASLVCSVVAGGINLASQDTRPIWLLGVGGAFVASLLQPRAAWRWCIVVAAAVPVSYIYAEMFDVSADIAKWAPATALFNAFAPVPAAYVAVLIRLGIGRLLLPRVPHEDIGPLSDSGVL